MDVSLVLVCSFSFRYKKKVNTRCKQENWHGATAVEEAQELPVDFRKRMTCDLKYFSGVEKAPRHPAS